MLPPEVTVASLKGKPGGVATGRRAFFGPDLPAVEIVDVSDSRRAAFVLGGIWGGSSDVDAAGGLVYTTGSQGFSAPAAFASCY